MSSDRSSSRTFELEGLEPRLLLSADGIAAGDLRPLERVDDPLQAITITDTHSSAETVTAAESDLFSGVADEPLVAAPAVELTSPDVVSGVTETASEEAAAFFDSEVPTAATMLGVTSLTGQSDLLSKLLTTTLTAANGPPSLIETQDSSVFASNFADDPVPVRAASVLLSSTSAETGEIPSTAAVLPPNTFELGALRITTTSVSLSTLEDLFNGTGGSVSITGSISIDGFFYLSGSFTISAPSSRTVTVATGNQATPSIPGVEVWAVSISAINVFAFVGVNGPQKIDSNNNGVLEEAEPDNPEAIGLAISGLDIGLVMMKTKTGITNPAGGVPEVHSFYALRATADFAGLVGIGSAFQLEAHDIEVNVNTGNPWIGSLVVPVVNFSGAGVFNVPTGGDPIVIDYAGQILAASAERVLMRISDFVYVSGGFSLNAGGTEAVDVNTGLMNPVGNPAITGLTTHHTSPTDDGQLGAKADGSMIWNLPVRTLEMGLSDVDVFVGYTDAGALATAATNGELTRDELIDAGAIGLFLDEVELGLLVGSVVPQIGPLAFLNASLLKFTALQVDADLVELLGVPGLNLSASKLQVRVNQGSGVGAGWGPGFATPVIDFVQSYPHGTHAAGDPNNQYVGGPNGGQNRRDGYRVATNNSGAYTALYFEDPVVGASSDRVLLRISDFVYVSGGFSFNAGGTETVDVQTGLINPTLNTVINGLKGLNTSNTDNGALGAKGDGSMIWNLPIRTLEVGLSDVDVFVGYTDGAVSVLETAAMNGELTKLELEGAGAIGLFLDEADLGLLVGSVVPQVGPALAFLNTSLLRFTALQGDTSLVELLGVPGLNVSASKLQVRVNQGSGVGAGWGPGLATPVIDFVQSYPHATHAVGDPDNQYTSGPNAGQNRRDGYRVPTNTSGAYKALYFEDPVIGASSDRVLLRISDFVYVSGGFSFNAGGTEAVDVQTGLINPSANTVINGLKNHHLSDTDDGALGAKGDGSMIWNLPIRTLEVGLSDVDVFVGYTDGAASVLETAAMNGELTKAELEGASAIGLFLDEADLGLLVGSVVPQVGPSLAFLNTSLLRFTALQGDTSLVELLGVPGLNLSASKLQVRVNQGSGVGAGWGPGLATPVIDFVQSYPHATHTVGDPDNEYAGGPHAGDDRTDGYRVPTNTSGAYKALYFEDSVVGASSDRVLLRISDFVYVSGGFSFNAGGTEAVDVQTGLINPTLNTVINGLKGHHTSPTDDGLLGAKGDGSMIWNLPIRTLEVGLSDVDVFVGYTDGAASVLETAAMNGELTKTELEGAGAIGLFLDEADLGLLVGSVVPQVGPSLAFLNTSLLRFTALQGDTNLVELLGVPGLNLSASKLQVRVNQGSGVGAGWGPGLATPVIDFVQSYPHGTHTVGDPDNQYNGGPNAGQNRRDGYRVPTNTSGAYKALYFEDSVVGASSDRVLLRISDFVYVSGGFSFNAGGTEAVDVQTGLINPTLNTVINGLKGHHTSPTDDGLLGAKGDGSMIWNLPIRTLEVGLSDVDVFVGYTDGAASVLETAAMNGELTKLELENAGAIGLFLDEADLGLLVGSVVPQVGPSLAFLNTSLLRFTALQGDTNLVELLGVPGLNLSASKLQVRVNQGSGVGAGWGPGLATPVIDFVQSYPHGTHTAGDPDNQYNGGPNAGQNRRDGYRVPTNTSGAYKALYFDDSVVGASSDRVLLRISDFVYVSGGFSFNAGGTEAVDVQTGLINPTLNTVINGLRTHHTSPTDDGLLGAKDDGSMIWNLPIRTLEVGLSDVDVFVGYTDGAASVLETAAMNGELTKLELEGAGAIGLFLDEADLGLLVGSVVPQVGPSLAFLNASLLRFTALQGDTNLVELLGVPGLNLSASKLQVRVNQGSGVGAGWGPGLATPVIDFVQSYPHGTYTAGDPDNQYNGGPNAGQNRRDGYRVPTNTSGAYKALYFEDSVVGASSDRVLLRISDFVYVSGGFSFNAGGTEAVDVQTGLINPTLNTVINGLKTYHTSPTDDGLLGAKGDGSMIWNLPIRTLEVGLSDVDVFVGYTDGAAGVLETAALNGELTKAELEGAGAIGLFLDEADLGLLVGSVVPQVGPALAFLNTSLLKFTALQGDTNLVELLGVPGLNLSASMLQVRVNQGSGVGAGWGPGLASPVIDFVQSYPHGTHTVGDPDNAYVGGPNDGEDRTDGYRVPTNTSGAYKALYFEDSVVGASSDRVLLRISDFVYVSGGFSFNAGGTEAVDVRTGLTNPIGNPVINGLQAYHTSATDDGQLGAKADGSMIWNLPIRTVEVGLTDVDVFVGYTEGGANALETAASNGELTREELLAAGAIGLFLDEAELGLLVGSAVPQVGPLAFLNAGLLKFTALQGDTDLVELLGVPGVNLSASMLQVRVNMGSGVGAGWAPTGLASPAIDFVQSYPHGTYTAGDPDNQYKSGPNVGQNRRDGYRVPTNTSGAYKALYYDDSVIGASSDRVLLRVSDFVYVSGGFSFNKGGTEHVDVKTNLSQPHAAAVLGPLLNTNTGNTGTTLGANADGSVIYNLPIQTIEIGLSNVDVFVGYTDPASEVLEDAATDTGELTEADLVAAKAVGLLVDEANLGMVIGSALPVSPIGTGTLNAAALKFFALKADANLVGLVGIPGFEISGRGIRVEVNSGSKFPIAPTAVVGPAIDWLMSYPDTDGNGTGDAAGFEVATGTTTPPALIAMSQFIIGGGAENIHIELGDFVYLDGSIYFEMGTTHTVDLADSALPIGEIVDLLELDPAVEAQIGATSKEVVFLSIGGKDLQAFFGVEGPYWVDADNDGVIDRDSGTNQIIDAETNDEAMGLVIDDLTFGLVFATPTNTLDPSRYVALKGDADLIGLVGLEPHVTMRAQNITVELNISTPLLAGFPLLPVIDWVASFPDTDGNGTADIPGYGVKTGARTPAPELAEITVELDMEELLIKAGIGFMTMDVLGIVSLSGSVGVEIGPSANVTLANGSSKPVKTLSFGAANVYGFLGYNGPYVHDSSGNGYVDRADFATNPDGSLGAPLAYRDGLSGRPKAVGIAINDLDIGILLMVSTAPSDLGVYLAAKLRVENFGLVGISGLTATGAFDVELNVGFGLSGVAPSMSPVDLLASFGEARTLFALMDTNSNEILDATEQNAALETGYIGENITSIAQLVSLLNASTGPPDEFVTISEARAKLKDSFESSHQAAINALDADEDGRLDVGFEVFTGNTAPPIGLDFDNFLISVQLGGEIKYDGVFRMYGVFLFEADPTGLKAFVAAGIEVGPDINKTAGNKLFSMNALGALVINGAGLAADIEVSASIGGALQSVLSLNASARIVFNTTGADQIITIPQRYAGFITGTQSIVGALPTSTAFDPANAAALAGDLAGRFTTNPDGSLRFTIDRRAPRLDGGFDAPGSYFLVEVHGDLTIARTFVISADFHLKVSGQAIELGFNGEIDLGGFITVDAEGGAVLEGGVFAAYARLEIEIDIAGIEITGGADFEINTGSSSKSVFDAQHNAHVVPGNTYMVSVDADIDLFGVLDAEGDVRIGIEDGNFLIDVDATLDFFGILDVEISGYFNTNGTFSFTGSLDLRLTVGSGASEFGITGGLSVTLSNSGFSGHGEVGLVVLGTDINIASATVTVNWDTGAWLIRAEGPLSVWLEVSTDGDGGYEIDGGLGFFEDVLEALEDVAEAIAEGVTAAANAIAAAIEDLGEAILEFGEDVVEFFEDVGEAIADAAEAVWDAISGFFEDERTIITATPVNPLNYYQYSAELSGGTLTITNGTNDGYAQQLTVWIVDGNVIVDAPDYVAHNVEISRSQYQERDYEWDGLPPWGQWSDWYDVGDPVIQTTSIPISNARNFLASSVTKIVINGTNNAETIVLDRNTISKPADVHANGGNDVIVTGKGNDRVWGGDGNDTIFTYEGNDELYGENHNDKLFGGVDNDLLNGGAGDDLLDENKDRADPSILLTETNTLIGGPGADKLLGSPGKDTINGGADGVGADPGDVLLGLSNDDTYVFINGYGTDQFVDYHGKETLDFAGASDTLTISMSAAGVTANAGAGNSLVIDAFAVIEQVKLGSGGDTLAVTRLPNHLFTITDAGGEDLVTVDDSADTANNIGVLTNSRLTGLGMGNANQTIVESSLGITYSNIEDLVVSLGSGNDTFTITSSPSGTGKSTILNTGAGTDTVNVTSTGADSTTTLNGDAGNDVFNVKAIGGATTINAGNDSDTINVGSNAAGTTATPINNTGGNVNGIGAALTIHGNDPASGSDTLIIDDSSDTLGNTGTLTANTITGLGLGGTLTYGTIEHLTITLGSGGDNLTITDTHGAATSPNQEDTTVNTGSGADTVVINSVTDLLTVNASTQADTITVNGTGIGSVTTLNGDAGSDIFNVKAIGGAITVNAGTDSDTVNVGSNAAGTTATPVNNTGGNVNGISASLTINGNEPATTGADALNVDDTGDTSANTGALTANSITGLGMTGGGITYGTFENLTVSLGSGADTLTITNTHGAGTGTVETTVVNAGAGADIVQINNATDSLTVNGQADGDTISVYGTSAGSLATLNGDGGNDFFNIRDIDGETRVRGGADDDTVRVNVNNDGSEHVASGATVNGVGALLDLDGQLGSDTYIVYLAGVASSASHPVSLINVHDTGGAGNGADFMEVFGTDNVLVSDNFLIRRNFIALLPDVAVGGTATAERINYDNTLETGVSMYGRAGADRFVFDDNSTKMTVNGGAGADTFQFGQMFQSKRVSTPELPDAPAATVAFGDEVTTVHTTQGYLTPGVRFETIVYGGDGNDQFLVLSNQGPVSLFGDDGDDRFIVRAFALFGSEVAVPNRETTNINTGLGADAVEYNVNAPVGIDGGDGFDTLAIVGTEFSDTIVVTAAGISGAGLFVTYTGIERLEVDGAEGNDLIIVLSTPEGVVVRLFGGLGSDTFNVGGEAAVEADRNVGGIRGPVIVDGGANPEVLTVLPAPVMYLGEINPTHHVSAPNANFAAIEADQIDSLWVYNDAAIAAQAGMLTQSRLFGLGMGGDLIQGPITFGGGITYWNFEMVSVYLGQGVDTFEIQSTHGGDTLVDGGLGNDVVTVRTVLGHTSVHGNGGDDQIHLGTPGASGPTIDLLRALVTVDGGTGSDTVNVDDRGDANHNNGILDQTTLTGLDLLEAQVATFQMPNGAVGNFTLTVAGATTVPLSTASMLLPTTAGSVRDALLALAIPGVTDITVNKAGNFFRVGFLGDETLAPLVVSASFPVTSTAASMLNRVQTISLSAASGTFAVTIGSGGPVFSITVGDSANTVRNAIIAALNPAPASASGVGVKDVFVSRFGSTYEVLFQGLLAGGAGATKTFSVLPADTSGDRNFVPPIAVASRTTGVNYYTVETFNLDLGSGSEVLNIRGTSAVTNVATHDGDDRVYVSSLASETLASAATTDFLIGHLDRVQGTLNLDLGNGRHLLMISDESTLNGNGTAAAPALITDQPVVGLPATEITITGLTSAPAITYKASATGTFADGITIWTGYGPDVINVNGTHQRGDGSLGSLRTVTTLNTGLGSDTVKVDLNTADGFFVLNTQGPENGSPGTVDHDNVDASTSTRPLVIFGGQGNDTIRGGQAADIIFGDRGTVTLYNGLNIAAIYGQGGPGDRTDGVERPLGLATTTFPAVGGNDTVFALEGRDYVFGGLGDDILDASAADVADDILVGDNGQAQFTAGVVTQVDTSATNLGGNDTLTAGKGANVAFGGVGDDTIFAGGDALSDTLVGDNGTAKFDPANGRLLEIFTTAPVDAGRDVLTTGDGSSVVLGGSFSDLITTGAGHDIIVGDNGRAVFDPVAYGLISIETSVPAQGTGLGRIVGAATYEDVIAAGEGRNVVFGGSHSDHITSLGGDDIVVGDNGSASFVVRDGNPSDLDLVTSTDFAFGGADYVTSGAGSDIVIGGPAGDTILGGDGNNIGIGDSGIVTAANENGHRFGTMAFTVGKIETTAFGVGAADTINTGTGHDVVLGGHDGDTINAGNGDNVVLGDDGLLDYVREELGGVAPGADLDASDIDAISSLSTIYFGGVDNITTGSGNDIVIGGRLGDTIATQGGRNIVIGDSGLITAANENGNRFGAQPITVGRIETTSFGDGGVDQITTLEGVDLVLGGHEGDTINAGDGDNVVIGDDGVIEFTRQERDGLTPGADLDASDIDLITSLSTTSFGGADNINTGTGNDIVVGGRLGDTIATQGGRSVVVGDSGVITAASEDGNRFGSQPITVGRIETMAFGDGGVDQITTLGEVDVILGGHEGDTINAGAGDNVVVGDDGAIEYVRLERGAATGGADLDAADIDLVTSLSTSAGGGADTINTGSGNDVVIGGRFGDVITVQSGRNLVIGDSGTITAANENANRFGSQAMTVGRIETTAFGDGGMDQITALGGIDMLLGGHDNDTIHTGEGDNAIIGDDGVIEYVRLEREPATAGADLDASDIDLMISLSMTVGSSRVDLQACKLEYSIVSPK